ncbi:MAG TPA: hypothetical protein VLV31_10845 [Candidatus Acidoferrales bacterium]|nr:hypothetical protein [Candidatus Acidoferrales bacterium]
MKTTPTREFTLAALILAVSLIALSPAPIHANGSPQTTQPITINATGEATKITDAGISGPTTLTLKGSAYTDSSQTLQIQNATGTIQIGSTTYTLTNGHGSANKLGDVFVETDISSGGQLYLHGTLQGNNVTFIAPESRLASLASLALTGPLITSSVSNSSLSDSENTSTTNSTTAVTKPSTTTANQSIVITSSNRTQSTKANSTQMARTNTTLTNASANIPELTTTQISSLNSTLTSSTNMTQVGQMAVNGSTASTTSSFSNSTIPFSLGTSGNVTVTVTQTVATITINHTVTVTAANVTVTEANATSTVNATTTVSTSTNP